jgi:hypothetical protein
MQQPCKTVTVEVNEVTVGWVYVYPFHPPTCAFSYERDEWLPQELAAMSRAMRHANTDYECGRLAFKRMWGYNQPVRKL